MKKIYSGLILIIFTISLIMPVTTVYASDDREVISEVEAESNDIDSIPVFGGDIIHPSFIVTKGEPAYFYTAGISGWQRKEGEVWQEAQSSGKFRAGVWRYKCKICIDNDPEYTDGSDGNLYKLAEKISLKINDESEQLIIENSTIGSNYSNAIIYSKEYLIPEPSKLTVYNSNEMNISTNTKGIPITEYSIAPYVEGGVKPYVFSKVSGARWVNISNDGTVSGTPTEVGDNSMVTILVQDSSTPKQSEEIQISVANTEVNLNEREIITEIIASSYEIDAIPVCGDSIRNPEIKVTSGNPARFLYTMGFWQKKNESTGIFENVNQTGTFDNGTWRFACKVNIDNLGEDPTAGDNYKLGKQISVKVNNELWNVEETEYINNELHRSVAQTYSKEYFLTNPGYFVVSFESNGGNYIESQVIQKGKKATKPDDPTREGYAFDGWYKEKTLKNQFDFNVDTISTHTVLYAKWLKLYTINAKTSLDGTKVEKGSVEGIGIFKEGERVTLKVNVDDRCFFEAWKEDNKSKEKQNNIKYC